MHCLARYRLLIVIGCCLIYSIAMYLLLSQGVSRYSLAGIGILLGCIVGAIVFRAERDVAKNRVLAEYLFGILLSSPYMAWVLTNDAQGILSLSGYATSFVGGMFNLSLALCHTVYRMRRRADVSQE